MLFIQRVEQRINYCDPPSPPSSILRVPATARVARSQLPIGLPRFRPASHSSFPAQTHTCDTVSPASLLIRPMRGTRARGCSVTSTRPHRGHSSQTLPLRPQQHPETPTHTPFLRCWLSLHRWLYLLILRFLSLRSFAPSKNSFLKSPHCHAFTPCS